MRFEQSLVAVTAIVFLAYGIGFIVAPTPLAIWVTGTAPTQPSALIDLRATYGGMSLGVGVVLLGLATPAMRLWGLRAVLVLMLGMAGGRTVGLLVDGPGNLTMTVYLLLELLLAAAAAVLLLRARRS